MQDKGDTIAPFSCANVAFGQLLSVLIACSGVFSELLNNRGASFPAFQSFLAYVLIFVCCTLWRFKNSEIYSNRVDLWVYVFLAVVDCQANFLVITAFRYANFATIALLLHMSIPFVTILSYYVLDKRYFWKHYLGSLVALFGSLIIFISDFTNDSGIEELKGDALCVVAAALYAISNTIQEWCVTQGGMASSFEFLSLTGFFACIFTGVQFVGLEASYMSDVDWDAAVIFYFIAYAANLFAFYLFVSIFLRVAEAVLLNLSLLTADFYTVLASFFVFHQSLSPYYWAALALNTIGIAIYSIEKPPHNIEDQETDSYEENNVYSMVSTPDAAEIVHSQSDSDHELIEKKCAEKC